MGSEGGKEGNRWPWKEGGREARYYWPRKKIKTIFREEVGEMGAEEAVGLTQVVEAGEKEPQRLTGSSEG